MTPKETLKLILGWRLIVLTISMFTILLVAPRIPFVQTGTNTFQNVFSVWSNFDGKHYLDIAENGYSYQYKTDKDYGLFPVYPLLIRKLNFFSSYLTSGLLISHIALFVSLLFLYELIKIDFKSKIAQSAIILLLIFPTSFYLGSVYTESFFLMLSVMTFYFARQKKFLLAGLFAAIASGTRITGIFLLPALAYEIWLDRGQSLKSVFTKEKILALLAAPAGLLFYMRFLLLKTGNPLYFTEIQANFAGRSSDKLILLHQIFFRYLKMIIFVNHTDPLFYTVLLELLSAVIIILFLLFAFKKIRFSYWVFVAASFFLPTLTGTFMRMPRYTIVLFPVFIFLATWIDKQHPFIKIFYYTASITLGILGIVLFTSGYFVS